MAYTYDFKDSVTYGADDINNIRKTLCTNGVLPESEFSCDVVKVGNKIKITKGQAIFADGSRIEVDNEGVELTYTSNVKNYVYFNNNIVANKAECLVSTTQPIGDIINLATVEIDGTVTNNKDIAILKVPLAKSPYEKFYKIPYQKCGSNVIFSKENNNLNKWIILAEIEVPVGDFNIFQIEQRYILVDGSWFTSTMYTYTCIANEIKGFNAIYQNKKCFKYSRSDCTYYQTFEKINNKIFYQMAIEPNYRFSTLEENAGDYMYGGYLQN